MFLLCIHLSCKSNPKADTLNDENKFDYKLPDEAGSLPVSVFSEVWAYVASGNENALKKNLPITDIGYFAASVNSAGKLIDIPVRKKLSDYSGRVHLIAICSGYALSHFVLVPGSNERKELIADLINASKDFDGLQIDYEEIHRRDADNFLSFLSELKAGLGDKIFSIALPARTRIITDEPQFNYAKIASIADRILIMAYDENWSGSQPGPVASMPWCQRVAKFAMEVIGNKKLIMGLPFYGRAWEDKNHARAWISSGIGRIINEYNITDIKRDNGVPYFNYQAVLSVKVYYDDFYSLSARMEMYKEEGVRSIGFWRLGYEDMAFWNLIELGN